MIPPHRRAKICPHPGCPNINCQEHARPVRRMDTRPSAARRGYDQKWRRIRAMFLKKHPSCVVCGAPATEVDHVLPLAEGGTNEWSNLRSMCKSHHSQHTARSGGGFGNPKGKGRQNR